MRLDILQICSQFPPIKNTVIPAVTVAILHSFYQNRSSKNLANKEEGLLLGQQASALS